MQAFPDHTESLQYSFSEAKQGAFFPHDNTADLHHLYDDIPFQKRFFRLTICSLLPKQAALFLHNTAADMRHTHENVPLQKRFHYSYDLLSACFLFLSHGQTTTFHSPATTLLQHTRQSQQQRYDEHEN